MVKWSFNTLLLSKLADVLDISVTEIAKRSDINQPVLYHYIKGDVEPTIQALIKVCNAIRMPIYYFFSENNRHIIPNRENATFPLDQWHPISWNGVNVKKIFGSSSGKINWKDVAVAMDSSSQKPHERFALRRRFKVTDFLKTCNTFSLSPFLFLVDPNRQAKSTAKPKLKESKGKRKEAPPSYEELTLKVDIMQQEISVLTEKFEKLLHDHEALAKRVQVNIQNVHNSRIGITGRMDIAAESAPYAR